jgi:hypothetical protein
MATSAAKADQNRITHSGAEQSVCKLLFRFFEAESFPTTTRA